MNSLSKNWLIIFLLLFVIAGVVGYLLMKGQRVAREESKEVVTSAEKMDLPREKLDEAWEEAKRSREEGGLPITKKYPMEMGNKEAKVRVDAFFPGPGEGLVVSSDVLGKLVKEQKDRLYVRISLLSGKMPEILGLSCAAIFINGRNYITVDGKEIVLMRHATHNASTVEGAVRQAIKKVYGAP
ncbi:MAG: hypothetical protein ACPLPS_01510 [bacterium]